MPPLTREQRYQIECDLRSGLGSAQIAQRLPCSLGVLKREIARCGSVDHYTAERATEIADDARPRVVPISDGGRHRSGARLKRRS